MKPRPHIDLILSLLLTLVSCISFSQNRTIDSLFKLLKNDKEDTAKVIHLNLIGWEFVSDPDTSLILGDQALTLSEKLHWKKGMATSLGQMGVYNFRKGNLNEALEWNIKALKVDEEIQNKKGMAVRLGNIAMVYLEKADFSKALEAYFKTLKLFQELKNKNSAAKTLGNIGVLYEKQGEDSKALDYYMKALKIQEETGTKSIGSTLGNVGGIYLNMRNYSKAFEYYEKALEIHQKEGNKKGIAIQLANMGHIYGEKKQYAQALEYYSRSLKLREELGSKSLIGNALENIGWLYIKTGKYNDAFTNIYKSLAIFEKIGALNDVKHNYFVLSDLYEASDVPLPDSAGGKILNKEQMRLRSLYYFKRYVAIRDTIYSEESKKELVRKEMNYEFDKKEFTAKAEQEKKDALAAEELKIKEQQRNYFIAGFALVALLSLFILRGYRQKQKANVTITQQKKMVDEKQQEILDSIHYAKRIQNALITNEKYIEKNIERLTKI